MAKVEYDMAINWTQVNVPTILAVVGAAVGVFQYINSFDKRLTSSEEYRVMRSQQTDQKFLDIANSLNGLRADNAATRQIIGDVPYRVGNLEKGQETQNERVNRLSELILNTFDGFRKDSAVQAEKFSKDINGLGTKIEVLTSRIDNSYNPQRTEMMLRPNRVQRTN